MLREVDGIAMLTSIDGLGIRFEERPGIRIAQTERRFISNFFACTIQFADHLLNLCCSTTYHIFPGFNEPTEAQWFLFFGRCFATSSCWVFCQRRWLDVPNY